MSVDMTITYEGHMHSQLTHGPSGARLQTDAPKDNMGKGGAFSPTDLVGAALLSCAVTTMEIVGGKEGIAVQRATGRVEKDMQSNPRRIARLRLEIELPSVYSPAERTRLEAAARTCPVALSLSPDVSVEMHFSYR